LLAFIAIGLPFSTLIFQRRDGEKRPRAPGIPALQICNLSFFREDFFYLRVSALKSPLVAVKPRWVDQRPSAVLSPFFMPREPFGRAENEHRLAQIFTD
jgi:hypothetical protein